MVKKEKIKKAKTLKRDNKNLGRRSLLRKEVIL
jgi:hypothetical protein